jgi:hypothetical protein
MGSGLSTGGEFLNAGLLKNKKIQRTEVSVFSGG